jgi:hypothetical protein
MASSGVMNMGSPPKIAVYKNTKNVAAPPTLLLFSAAALIVARARPPAANIQIPCPTDPQYRVHRRPMRSKVNTQIKVANLKRDQFEDCSKPCVTHM